jgi:hypothetical protein
MQLLLEAHSRVQPPNLLMRPGAAAIVGSEARSRGGAQVPQEK